MLLFACKNKNDQVPSSISVNTSSPLDAQIVHTPNQPSWDIGDGGFLSKHPCGPPCFMGITPGISTKDEVLEFLKTRIELSSCDIWDTRNIGGTDGVSCELFAFTFDNANIVSSIGFAADKELYINEVIEVYGNPDSLFVVWEQDDTGDIVSVQMNLYYDSIYTRLDLIEQQSASYKATPDVIVKSISFLDYPTYERYKEGAKPWEGFGEYPVSTLP
jgi:hypothetical protein